MNKFMDADGRHWTQTGEHRYAYPGEYYIDPYSTIYTGNYPKVRRVGPSSVSSENKVFIVVRSNSIASKTNWSGN